MTWEGNIESWLGCGGVANSPLLLGDTGEGEGCEEKSALLKDSPPQEGSFFGRFEPLFGVLGACK